MNGQEERKFVDGNKIAKENWAPKRYPEELKFFSQGAESYGPRARPK